MTIEPFQPFPPRVQKWIDQHHRDGTTEQDCLACSSGCCSQGGFAILENVLLIHKRYQNGRLRRKDFSFEPGCSFKEFVFKYFDVYQAETGKGFWKKRLLTFYMKSVSSDDHLITVPGIGPYHFVRGAWFQENPWLNKGCVFLSQKVPNWPEDDQLAERHCILHDPQSSTHLTAEPIDCVFHTCEQPMRMKVPPERVSERWFRTLAVAYPHSVERLQGLLSESGQGESHRLPYPWEQSWRIGGNL